MKENDIQIGDWVRWEYGELVKDFRVDSLIRDHTEEIGVYSDRGFMGYADQIEPIPLTAEILKKNGFRYTNNHTLKGADTYVLYLEQNGFDFTITIKLNDWFTLDSFDDRMYRLVEISTGRWFVHDLQHALRLCGIKKEITLF